MMGNARAGGAIKGLLFDKDGTLFDFQASWSVWAARALSSLAPGDAETTLLIAETAGYDMAARRFHAHSIAIASTLDELALALSRHLPGRPVAEIAAHLSDAAANTPMVEATPLAPLLADLRAAGFRLGVATNDGERALRRHLENFTLVPAFDFLAGFDSGHGAKPAPGMCLAFATAMALPVEACVMIGDSTHDLLAGRAAGMRTLGVLTGVAEAAELAPHADAVLPDISHLPEWLRAQG